jgi:hypothetical protein
MQWLIIISPITIPIFWYSIIKQINNIMCISKKLDDRESSTHHPPTKTSQKQGNPAQGVHLPYTLHLKLQQAVLFFKIGQDFDFARLAT